MSDKAFQVHKHCLYRDGTHWCAVGPGFIDIMASPAGFGLWPSEAVEEYLRAASQRYRRSPLAPPTVEQFMVCEGNPVVTGEGQADHLR